MLDASQITIPAIVGAIVTFIIPLFLNRPWAQRLPRGARFAIVVAITLGSAGAVIFAWLKPDTWETVTAGLAAAFAVGQAIYNMLKSTGIFDWLGQPSPTPELQPPQRAEADNA